MSKVALVTGALGGLGTAISQALAKEGYKVVAAYHPEFDKKEEWLAEQEAAGFKDFVLVPGDVSDYESAKAMIAEAEAKAGPIDILVNNAGITRDSTFHRMKADQWMDVINTNLNSVFNVTRPVIEGMRDRKWGRVIQISSINGLKGQYGQANYAAAKAGMHGFTISLARENARNGVTVNTISPGYIATDMVMAVPEEVRAKIVADIPTGRLGTPDEIAYGVAFLADEQASWITGSNLDINGGHHMGW